jgi:hypothetical protein
MNNQEIIDKVPEGNFKSVLIQPNLIAWGPTDYRSLADIKRIVELEKALDKLIDRAQQVDSWESFPDTWLNEAYEVLKEPKP